MQERHQQTQPLPHQSLYQPQPTRHRLQSTNWPLLLPKKTLLEPTPSTQLHKLHFSSVYDEYISFPNPPKCVLQPPPTPTSLSHRCSHDLGDLCSRMGDRDDLDRLFNLCCSRRALDHRHILCGVAGLGCRRRLCHLRVREDCIGVHGRLAEPCEAEGRGA